LKLYYRHAVRRERNARVDHLDDLMLAFTGKPHPHSAKLRRV